MKRIFCLLLSAFCLLPSCSRTEQRSLAVGSKNYTESVLLGEILAQKLEANGCTVDRRLNMGGTFVCDTAIRSGSIDAYVEYSGTALAAILKQPTINDPARVHAIVRDAYAKRGLRWSPALGFNNTHAMSVRRADSERLGLHTISDLAKVTSTFQPGFGFEFSQRPDGWPGLIRAYGLQFAKAPRVMDLGLTYKAAAAGEVDFIAGNSTDGLIPSLGLVVLEDDKHFFPPYEAVVVQRMDIDRHCRGASAALESLRNSIDDDAMRRLNYEVDGKKRPVADVAREFLAARK